MRGGGHTIIVYWPFVLLRSDTGICVEVDNIHAADVNKILEMLRVVIHESNTCVVKFERYLYGYNHLMFGSEIQDSNIAKRVLIVLPLSFVFHLFHIELLVESPWTVSIAYIYIYIYIYYI